MAQCLQLVNVSGTQVLSMDNATPAASCALLAINGSEYAQLSHGYIDSQADAEAIVGALLLLFATVFIFKMLARALNVGDDTSDEKH